jgi:hypothetical protein
MRDDYLMFLTEDQREGGSEFGGADGLTPPYPHTPRPSEQLRAIYQSNPTDAESISEEAAPSVFEGNY